jgi:uncharacterized membrane protein
VSGSFCQSCGTAVSGPAGHTPPSGIPPPPPLTAAGGLQENVAGALCYSLWFVTGILFLVLEPYSRNRNIRFHAFQSILLSLGFTAVYFLLGLLSAVSLGLVALIWPFMSLGIFVLWLFLMWKTYNNERIVLPVVGEIAGKQAG